jgi:dTDP-4-dehydrorhamnose reductase
MINVLVTGANGQLAQCIREQLKNNSSIKGYFATKEALDISNKDALQTFFDGTSFDYCINTAAYTDVEKAENEPERAFLINEEGARNISEVCKQKNIVLVHISTDYVFDGTKGSPYVETDKTHPLNVYGASKLAGEMAIQENWNKHFIIRTSWLYSQYGHNFLNSMLRFAKEGKALTITTEQTGTPTNANDLARAILHIICTKNTQYGLYHYSNIGAATWYDFAQAIFEISQEIASVKLAKTDHYPTFAKRPAYSVMNCNKLFLTIGIKGVNWRESLKEIIINK